ncbi:MAG: LysM peptidoglycan-binding domain-containing protein [Candidatus Nealsonbacteria bacterium]
MSKTLDKTFKCLKAGWKKSSKPLVVAVVLILLVFITASRKSKDVIFLPTDLPETASAVQAFLGANQKPKPELPEFITINNNSFRSTSPPYVITPKVLGALVGGLDIDDIQRTEITEYIVEDGDTLWVIANSFDISLETLMWANELTHTVLVRPGQKLIIPPVTGVIHHVKAGDTISEIAGTYKVKTEEIVSFNGLSSEVDILIGDILIIPNGKMPVSTQYARTWIPLSKSYFMCPISSPCRITQGLHWYNAIDFSHGKCGDSIYAAAGGQVLRVNLTQSTSRWAFSGAGNHITILHPNGVVTMYGHISTSFVSPGDPVYQGQTIALMGGMPGTPGAGMSTGCHVHFSVRGASNPFRY